MRFFSEKWEKEIHKQFYTNLLDPYNPQRYILDESLDDYEKQRKHSITKLKDWIESPTDYSEIPIPAQYKNSSDADFIEKEEAKGKKDAQNIPYQKIGKACRYTFLQGNRLKQPSYYYQYEEAPRGRVQDVKRPL